MKVRLREREGVGEREREGVSEWITVRNRRGGKPRREHLSDREDPRQLYRGNGLGQHANYQHQNWTFGPFSNYGGTSGKSSYLSREI